MIKEKYKIIPDTEFVPLREGIDPVFWNKYEINKLGEIKTLKTKKITKHYHTRHGKIPIKSFRVGDYKKSYPVHRLVALTFLEQECGKPEVDHINRDTLDFRLNNLRFVSRKENLRNRSKPLTNRFVVYQEFDNSLNLIREIPSSDIKPLKRAHINRSIVNKGKAYGSFWKRVDKKLEEYLTKYKVNLTEEIFLSIPNDPSNRKISSSGVVLEHGWIYSIGWSDVGGYREISIDGHPKYIHRIVYELFFGDTLTGEDYIDHLDTDPQNNLLNNLKK